MREMVGAGELESLLRMNGLLVTKICGSIWMKGDVHKGGTLYLCGKNQVAKKSQPKQKVHIDWYNGTKKCLCHVYNNHRRQNSK